MHINCIRASKRAILQHDAGGAQLIDMLTATAKSTKISYIFQLLPAFVGVSSSAVHPDCSVVARTEVSAARPAPARRPATQTAHDVRPYSARVL